MKAAKKGALINRELSWLEFNQRVLDEASSPRVPLLERLKFLAITGSNLGEFFMVRVGGLRLIEARGIRTKDPSGMRPVQQLEAVTHRARKMIDEQARLYVEDLEPALARRGIRRLTADALSGAQRQHLERFFHDEIAAVVTPVALSAEDRFPLLAQSTVHLCIRLAAVDETGSRFAVIPLGSPVRRIVPIPDARQDDACFMLVEDVVALHLDHLFPGECVVECSPLALTRNAGLEVEDEFSQDLLSEMEEMIRARRASDCVRLDIPAGASPETERFLLQALDLKPRDVYRVGGPLVLADFMALATRSGYDALKYETWIPQASPLVDPSESIFDTIRSRPVLLNHPFESFDPVMRLVNEAADDERVLAIKQILYRTSRESPIVAALKRAAMAGKYVTAVVELKARFDEARNIDWARELEEGGVQVVYGVKRLKTHAKVLVVMRREDDGIRRYVHFGTGNYNETTARLYTDISYMTCDPALGQDASTFLNAITGYSQPPAYLRIEQAPLRLRDRILELIDAEIQRSKQGQPAEILVKLNSLTDPALIQALYAASQAGVQVAMNIRGICCLTPGVAGISENIRVVSIVDRFLEHSRIIYFHHGGDALVFISSADWMPRNLDRRTELLVPVDDTDSRQRLVAILRTCLGDTVKGRFLGSDGVYRSARECGIRKRLRSQEVLYQAACDSADLRRQTRRTVFEPHKPE